MMNLKLQPLFRKIASSLPGMEALSGLKQDEMVNINLKAANNQSQNNQQGGGGGGGGCMC